MALPLQDFRVGDTYQSVNSGAMEVIANYGSRDVSVKFLETGTILQGLQRGNVVRGRVKDPFQPYVEGVGYSGTMRQVSKTEAHKCWRHMLVRCYNEKYHSTRETYSDCSVAAEWHNFCNFEQWYLDNHVAGCHLDKDLLVQGNRVYSSTTCCFIPPYLNNLIVEGGKILDGCERGVTKRRKKGSQVYNGLYNVSYAGNYLMRTRDLQEANSNYKDFKKLHFEELADKWEALGILTPKLADCLRQRKM